MIKKTHLLEFNKAAFSFLLIFPLLFTACAGGETQSGSGDPGGEDALLYVNPYKDECEVDGELQLCNVINWADTGDYSPYTGDIQNFEYEWGYGYSLQALNNGDVIDVESVEEKTAEPGGIKFSLTLTGGDGRIVETSEGTFEFYGEKSFVCSPDVDCQSLAQEIDQEEQFTFEFETPDNPADPYTLLAWN